MVSAFKRSCRPPIENAMSTSARWYRISLFHFYVACVIAGGAALIGALAIVGRNEPFAGSYPVAFAILVVFLAIGELRPLKWLRRNEGGEVTVSWTFAFAILLIASPLAALSTLALASILGDLSSRKPVSRSLFNGAQVTLSLAAGGAVLGAFGQRTALLGPNGPTLVWLPVVTLAAMTIFLLNGLFTCIVLALHQKAPLWPTVRRGVVLNMSIDGMLLALSPVFVVVARYSLLLLPLLIVTAWAVYRSAQLALAHQHEATHDQLTGLPNRRLFKEQAENAIMEAQQRNHSVAVMILDLNGFKEVNDRMGHHIGDLVLQAIGDRFSGASRSTDLVARLGGDEFAVLARPLESVAEAEKIAARVLETLRQPCTVQGLPVSLSASLGIAVYPQHGSDFGALLRNADVAMYRAKQTNVRVSTYSNERDRHNHGRLGLLTELLTAIENDDLRLQYQPKVDMQTRRLVGVEALVRWQHEQRGLVYPKDFIPLAEHTELIEPLTDFVLRAALKQCASWRDLGFEIPVAVNVSARNLHDLRFPARVRHLLEEASVLPTQLEIELTENTVMGDPVRTVSVAAELRAMGVRLSLDDFGTGYSSLATLRDLPVNSIKIDKSFVAAMATERGDTAIVRATIELAHSLGLETVAEGVEQMVVWEMLREFGCDTAQGFLISRAVDPHGVIDFLILATPSGAHLIETTGLVG